MSRGYDFCQIFVRNTETSDVMAELRSLLGRPFERRSIELPEAGVDVFRNPDRTQDSDDFVQWPVLVEITAATSAEPGEVVALTARILSTFWEKDWPSVAACDYEEELPWRGGIEHWVESRD